MIAIGLLPHLYSASPCLRKINDTLNYITTLYLTTVEYAL
jgi:hypothetical protein